MPVKRAMTPAERQRLCRSRRREKLLREREAAGRKCPACRMPMPLMARADSVTCSPRCRQFACREVEHRWSEPWVQMWIGAREHFRALAGLRPVDPELEELWRQWLEAQKVTLAGFTPPPMPPRLAAMAEDKYFGELVRKNWRVKWQGVKNRARRRLKLLEDTHASPEEVEKELAHLEDECRQLRAMSYSQIREAGGLDAHLRSEKAMVRRYKALLKRRHLSAGTVRLR
jgi:hypothetical protein